MRSTWAVLLVGVVACGKQAPEKAPDAAPVVAAPEAMAPPPAFSLAAAAGNWTYVAKSPTGDTVLVTGELRATADAAGWTLVLPKRPVMPLRVTVSGDSVMTSSGPYESVLRKGTQVTTDGVLRMSGAKMIGMSMAHYRTKGADSVRSLMIEATRKP